MIGRPLRLGLVGTGRWGQAYLRTAADRADCQIVATYNSTFRAELLDQIHLDGLIVATPPASHAAIAKAAIDRNIAVLIEKPLALSLNEARGLATMAGERNVAAMVDHTHLFHPAFRALKQEIAARGGPSIIRAIHAQAGNWGVFRNDVPVLWDWGAHDVAMILDILGTPPKNVSAKILEDHEIERGRGQSVKLDLQFDRAAATVHVSNLRDRRLRTLEVVCDAVTFAYDDVADQSLVRRIGSADTHIPVRFERPLNVVLTEFLEIIVSGPSQILNLAFGTAVVEILDACDRSIALGSSINLATE